MQNLLKLSDSQGQFMVLLSLSPEAVKRPAVDVVFDVLGVDGAQLIADGTLEAGQADDFQILQRQIFDSDDQGLFIRDDVSFLANGKPLDPDRSIESSFLPMRKEGVEYKLCDLVVTGGEQMPGATSSTPGTIDDLARIFFLHQVFVGSHVDVINVSPDLKEIIEWAEGQGLVEIDVQKTAYKLTEKGKRAHQSYLEEAQNLITRYDVFSDVDMDSSGNVFFDSNLGRDLRVAVYELEGVDPYRARFILGLNDGEWDKLDGWETLIVSEPWYREVFKVVDAAPSVDDVGKETLQQVVDRGKVLLRRESQTH